jgi:transcriptional regulator with XRE-family HTH domain
VEHTSLPMKLRVLRAERQLSLREASARTGVDKVALSRYERGLGRPQDLTLAKIAKGYGVGVEELLEEAVPLVDASETGRATTTEPLTLTAWLTRRCGHAYLAMTKEEVEGLFAALDGTVDEDRKARELFLQIREEAKVFNSFPRNASPEERIRMRKTIRESISQVAVNYGVALFESGLSPEYIDEIGLFVELQRTLDEDIA